MSTINYKHKEVGNMNWVKKVHYLHLVHQSSSAFFLLLGQKSQDLVENIHQSWLAQILTYHTEVFVVSLVIGSWKQGAVLSCETIPGAPQVIGHHIDEVHVPWVMGDRIQQKKNGPRKIIFSIPLPLKVPVQLNMVCNHVMKDYALVFFTPFCLTFIWKVDI